MKPYLDSEPPKPPNEHQALVLVTEFLEHWASNTVEAAEDTRIAIPLTKLQSVTRFCRLALSEGKRYSYP